MLSTQFVDSVVDNITRKPISRCSSNIYRTRLDVRHGPRQSTNAGSGSGGSDGFVPLGAGLISARTVWRRCCLTNTTRNFSIAINSPRFSCRYVR